MLYLFMILDNVLTVTGIISFFFFFFFFFNMTNYIE